MHVFEFSFYATTIVYTLLYHTTAAFIFAGFVSLYALVSFYPSLQSLSVRRKLALANWPAPKEGIIYNNIALRVDKLLAFLSTIPY
jgi:hypothetical protein